MGNWIPGDPTLVAQILQISSAYSPPPPEGFVSPMTWGVEENVLERFGAAGIPAENIECERVLFVFESPQTPEEYLDDFRNFYGPTMNAYAAAATDGREAELHEELQTLFNEHNTATDGGTPSRSGVPPRDRERLIGDDGAGVLTPARLEPALEQRVLAHWSAVLGVPPAVLDQDGHVVVADPRDFAADRRATIRTARGTLLLAAPIEESVALADPVGYSADVAARARAAGLLHYLAAPPAGDADPRVRVLTAADRPLLDALKERAGAAATEEADVEVEHPLAVGIVEDGRLVAIGSLLEEEADTVDVGVLVDQAQHRRGLGAAVVRDLARRAASTGNLVQYRCDVENEASASLARTCGFALWGVLTVAPPTTDGR